MKACILTICTTLMLLHVNGQDDHWDVYMAQFEKGPGSVLINMSLKNSAPNKDLPFILIAGVKFKDCDSQGLPISTAFEHLYKVSDSLQALIDNTVRNIQAGTFTYQCERTDYYYVADTINLRNKIAGLLSRNFSDYPAIISIKPDKTWSAYLEFLYPNEETMEYMENSKVLINLQKSGDKLEKERQVDHWIYFASETDRNCFTQYAMKNKFKIETKEKDSKLELPFKLQISRVDKVDLQSISKLTLELKMEAKKCNGDYDGWETFVIKE